MKKRRSLFPICVAVCTLIFLYAPLVALVIFSFNSGKTYAWETASLRWYQDLLFDSSRLWDSVRMSIYIALVSGAVSTIMGTCGAIGAHWASKKIRHMLEGILSVPMIIPEVIFGVGLLLFFTALGIKLGQATIVIAHITFCTPFVFFITKARLSDFDMSIIDAARDLGANHIDTLVRIIIPMLRPAIIAGFLLATTLSLEDFVITFFVAGPGSTTLPLYINSMIKFGVSPVINALSTIIILGTACLSLLGMRIYKASHS